MLTRDADHDDTAPDTVQPLNFIHRLLLSLVFHLDKCSLSQNRLLNSTWTGLAADSTTPLGRYLALCYVCYLLARSGSLFQTLAAYYQHAKAAHIPS